MRELPEPKITPVLLDEFKQALAGGRGDLDAWLEVNDEAEVRAFVLAIQKQAYEDGLNEVMKRILESQVRRMGSASDYDKGGLRAGQELEAVVNAMLTASKKEQQ